VGQFCCRSDRFSSWEKLTKKRNDTQITKFANAYVFFLVMIISLYKNDVKTVQLSSNNLLNLSFIKFYNA
jgi:hypothetical protein